MNDAGNLMRFDIKRMYDQNVQAVGISEGNITSLLKLASISVQHYLLCGYYLHDISMFS